MEEISNEKKLAVLGKIFQENIEEFGRFFFPNHLSSEIPDFHKEIYKLLKKDHKRLAIGAPRGFAKSTILSLVFLAWLVCMKKAHFVLIVSDTYAQSVLFLDALKAELESNEKLQAFYGKMTSDHWSEGEIITNGIMIKAVGAGMKVRGLKYRSYRPDYVLADDLENEELTNSAERRDKLERWFNGALVPSLSSDGKIIVVGTIIHYEALLAKLLDEDRYKEYVKRTYRATEDWKTTLWEEHLDIKRLLEIKEEYIAKGQGSLFYSEYLNEPISSEFQKFKREDLKFYKERELERKLLNTYFFIDRAYSLAKTADFTGLVLVSVDRDNNWYIRIAERFKGTEGELVDKIFYYARKFRVKLVGVEQKAFTNTFEPVLNEEMRKRDFYFNLEEVKSLKESKESRIEALVPKYENGSIFLLQEQTDLIDEMMRFPKAPHDDLCFVAGTKVATPTGNKNIEDIKAGDYVVTPFGLRRVLDSGKTGERDVVSNLGLTGTPDHKVFNGESFDNLDTLTYNNNISSFSLREQIIWRYKKLLCLMEGSIDLWEGRESIILVNKKTIRKENILKDFTWRFGNFIAKRKFQKGLLFIIKTVILLITTFLIWSVWMLGNIYRIILKKLGSVIIKKDLKNFLKLVSWLKYGIGQKRVENGTRSTEKSVGLVEKRLSLNAKNVEKSLKPIFQQEQDSAVMPVPLEIEENLGLTTKQKNVNYVEENLHQTNMTKEDSVVGGVQSVFNIKVDKDEAFYANGILVSNCDALSFGVRLIKRPFNRSSGGIAMPKTSYA